MQVVECKTQVDLTNWLQKNYSLNESIWLIYYKKTSGIGDLTYPTIVDILLCFGWVDSLPGVVDKARTKLRISPRNPKSNWSRINKEKVARLEQAGLIEPNGYRLIQIAKENGCWTALDDVENLILPLDLEKALKINKLLDKWHTKSRTFKRGFLETLLNTKKQETRDKKIEKLINDLEKKDI